MKRNFCLASILLMVFLLSGCSSDPSPADKQLEIDAVLTEQTAFGWEVNSMVTSGQDIAGLTQNSQYLEGTGVGEQFSFEKQKREALRLMREAVVHLSEINTMAKSLADSLFFFWDDTLNGNRIAIYYDSETGLATYYQVKYKFASWRPMIYDSAVVVVDINFTLDNSNDDRIRDLFRQQLFKETFFIQQIDAAILVTDYDGTEITGAEASIDTYYHPDRFLQHLKQSVEINPDQSGTLREDFTFRDNSTAFRSVTFYANHTGVFSKQLRDGTLISGTFNSVEDDLQGSYSETIDFPEGRYLDKILRSALVSLTLPDSIFNAEYLEEVYFSSGKVDSAHVVLECQKIDGIKITTLQVQKSNGAGGTFTIEEYQGEASLVGEWTAWNEYYITIMAEYYFDGSAHIHYEVFAPPYNPGDTPVLVADYDISPDGSGSGTITYQGEEYLVTFDGSATAEISKGDRKTVVNLFQ